MTELIFIEGVSGVGKSTMTHALAEELRRRRYTVREYPEGNAAPLQHRRRMGGGPVHIKQH